jgi:DNA-binding transcriptional LysR family regulator
MQTRSAKSWGFVVLDWEDLKTFLAIARTGNLSAAGRALRVSQTTMGRRLALLEGRAGAKLLQRTPRGFVLTPAGERILADVETMEAHALAAERAISGEDSRLEGLVRITTVETFGARIVTPALVPLHAAHPNIAIELITDTRPLSLARREADIAIRLAPFEQHDAIVQRVADMAFGLYASRAYLAVHGTPGWSDGGAGHRLIALQDDLAGIPEAQWLREIAPGAMRCVLANSRDVQLNACLAGLGLACLPRYLADDVPGLVRLRSPTSPPVRGIWLGVHRDMRHTPRIRAVLDILTTELGRRRGGLVPPAE